MNKIPRPTTLAATLAAKPWQTPIGLCCKAVSDAEEETAALLAADVDPMLHHEIAPEAVRSLIKARSWLGDAASMLHTKKDREMHAYLVGECDRLAQAQGFCPVERAA